MGHDWYIGEWSRTVGKRQVDFVRDLDWNKARVSLLFAGKQPYTRDTVNAVAAYLNIAPHELLQHPADAMAARQLRHAVSHYAVTPIETPAPATALKKVSSR